MPRAWRIVSLTPREGGGPPLKEYFLVAIDDPTAALAVLRSRREMTAGVGLVIDGEASPEYVDWLDLRPGQILCVVAL
jgi:hypothetical protein